MKIAELIALAKVRSGKSQKEMAQEMGLNNPNIISKIATGTREATASEIAYFAVQANLDPLKTLGEIEAERNPELAWVWGLTVQAL